MTNILRLKERKWIKISKLSRFSFKFNSMCKISTVKSHLACTFTKIMQENTLFSGKIYTAGTNFTRPPVATVVTNLNSAQGFEIWKKQMLWNKEFIIFYDDEALGEVWNAFTGVLSRWPSGRANIGFTNCCFCPCCCHCKLQYAFHLLLCCCCLVLLCISYWQ